MKKLILLFSIVLSVFSVKAQTNEQQKADKKAPKISFEQTTYDFGIIRKGSKATVDFVFKNTGKEPLVLTNVRSSCGCTIPTWPKDPIKKRKTGIIKVRYNSNLVGNFSKTITVYSNAEESPIKLRIKGTVAADVIKSESSKRGSYRKANFKSSNLKVPQKN